MLDSDLPPIYEDAQDDDQGDQEVPPDARECPHKWGPAGLADYSHVCVWCGKLTRPDGWHE